MMSVWYATTTWPSSKALEVITVDEDLTPGSVTGSDNIQRDDVKFRSADLQAWREEVDEPRQTGEILVVDDTLVTIDMVRSALEEEGHDVIDVMMPDGNGLDLLPKIRETASKPAVIICTSQGDPEGAELAIKNGAWEYVQKPSSIMEMTLPLLRALQYRKEKQAEKLTIALRRDRIIGCRPRLISCLDLLARAANSEANVLIEGETGTGKELMVHAIHNNGPRTRKNYVIVDCAALPETLARKVREVLDEPYEAQ